MPRACYRPCMANIQVKNIPEKLHNRLRRYAREQDCTLGDIILAEPKCMIGFAGPRVVKETTHSDLPPGFQTAEFMLERGFIDRIVPRKELRNELARLIDYAGK